MTVKKPNKVIAPVVIAGITVGFLASAYKFVFANKNTSRVDRAEQNAESTSNIEKNDSKSE